MRLKPIRQFILYFGLCLFLGCGQASAPVEGGTEGSLIAGETPIPDLEIKVYSAGSNVPLGFGATNHEGKFRLFLPKGDGALWLTPGEYTFTLESLGPVPPPLPVAYRNASKTQLKATWTTDAQSLDLKIPKLK